MKNVAKVIAWLGAALTGLATTTTLFGKYQPIAQLAGTGLGALGTTLASETSAGHPNGANSK